MDSSGSSPLSVTKMLKTGTSHSHLRGCITGGGGGGGVCLGRQGAGGCEQDPERGLFYGKVAWNSVAPGSGARKCLGSCRVLGRLGERRPGYFLWRPSLLRSRRTLRGFPALCSQPLTRLTGVLSAHDGHACPAAEPVRWGTYGYSAVAQSNASAPPPSP